MPPNGPRPERSGKQESSEPSPANRLEIESCEVPDYQANSRTENGPGNGNATLQSELERSIRALHSAQDRIAELTKAQLTMSGTLGQLTVLASTDALTGLSNRRRFTGALKANCQASTSQGLTLSVIMLDIDSFKSYNDSFGHAAGDKVIWVVAKLLLRHGGSDQIVSRFGGEEFAILIPSTDAARAIEIAERQRAAINSYPWTNRPVTASFGISTLDRTTDDPEMILEQADRALYHSKSQGRNQVTHHQVLTDPSPESDARPIPTTEAAIVPAPEGTTRGANLIDSLRPVNKEVAILAEVPENAWDALERFMQNLQSGGHSSNPYRDVLSAVRDATEAEIVFLCNDQSGEILGEAGDHVPFSEWYLRLTRKLAEVLPGGGIWKPSDAPWRGESTVVPEPSAALIVPVKSPRSCWLIAARFRDDHRFTTSDLRVVRVIWQLHIDHHRHGRVHDKLKETLFGVVRCLSAAIDAKDPYTCGHSERVARIAVRLGEEMGLSRGETSDLYLAGLLHDLGKLGIRDSVLFKEGPLTPEEYLHIQEHPAIGERIIANVTRLAYLRPGLRGHHERMDGKGYPDGLAGEAIPQMARILAVADACDAMMSVRRYRRALSEARIEQTFRDGAGTQWDPRIVHHFLDCRHELYAVIQQGLGQSVYHAVERAVGGGETMLGETLRGLRKTDAIVKNINNITP